MKNSTLDYKNRTLKNFKFRDYTSIYFGFLLNELNNYPHYFEFIDVVEDDKLENIAYQLYGSEDYSDIILLCNNENFLWSFPYSQDILMDQIEAIVRNLKIEMNITENPEQMKDFLNLRNEIYERLDESNSLKRRLRIPKPEFLADVIAIIHDYKHQNSEESWGKNII